jgi:ATP-dependent Lhr-like helicase
MIRRVQFRTAMRDATTDDPLFSFHPTVRALFAGRFPNGPTAAQAASWPVIGRGGNLLLISPTGTGKTFAAFFAIIDRLFREWEGQTLGPGLRCVYVSPLRSLGYDVERNLTEPLERLREQLGLERVPIRVGARTGDTSAHARRKLRDDPPHVLITTPESLSLLLSQATWAPAWRRVENLIVDEVHALVATKRGADLAVSLERLAAQAQRDPCRVGLSATCRPASPASRFLVGPSRDCAVVDVSAPEGTRIEVQSLIRADEAPHRGLTYRRLLRELKETIGRNRTTVVFANTRAFTEKITHDLRKMIDGGDGSIAAHHSALDAARRRGVESALKSGELRGVVTSTSLELGVDIGTADVAALVGLPGSVSRCLQRVGRSGHQVGAASRGVIFAATAAEIVGAAVTARAALEGRVEPLRCVAAPLDVLCQQIIGMACAGEWSCDEAFVLVQKAEPFRELTRADFDACLAFLAGDLAAPAGAFEPEPGATPRWTSARIWRHRGRFGLRTARVLRWFRRNVGTITSEESVRVLADGIEIGTLEGAYAERLQAGDRFVLDGRALEFRRLEGLIVHARVSGGDPELPRWSSDRQSLSAELAGDLARFREEAASHALDGPLALRGFLVERHDLEPDAAAVVEGLFRAQERVSEVPRSADLLVEESPSEQGYSYAFHAPLSRSACEAAGRAVAARIGRRFGRNLALTVADLGWSITLTDGARLSAEDVAPLLSPEGFAGDVLCGVDRGELPARRFRHVAATALMVLRNPEGGRTRVGGLLWVSNRLYPLVKAASPDHPLLRETRREVLDDLLDTRSALRWLSARPAVRFRVLDAPSPFTVAWIDAGGSEPLAFESQADALKRLHARLTGGGAAR